MFKCLIKVADFLMLWEGGGGGGGGGAIDLLNGKFSKAVY